MKANTLPKRGKRPTTAIRRPAFVSPRTLQQAYATASVLLGEHFPVIDAWLAEHEPDMWRQIRQEDDELFRLRQVGVRERTYLAQLASFLRLCEEAERLYYEAQPAGLSLPQLAQGERVAIYYELADGSLHKVSSEDA